MLVEGVAFKKTFSYAGFEMQKKSYEQPKIALLKIELELKAEKDNAEVRVDNVEEYQKVVDAEWNILYDKLERIYKSGAKVVLSNLPIGDVATQYFADHDMFCAGRVPEEDLVRTMKSCGGSIQTTVHDLSDNTLGFCQKFEENQVCVCALAPLWFIALSKSSPSLLVVPLLYNLFTVVKKTGGRV